jgi:hypothetical protein
MPCSSAGRGLLLAAVLAASACSGETVLPPPAPTAIEPAAGFTAAEVPVVIRGEAFYVRGSHGAGGPGGDRASAEYRAWLGGVPLSGVRWVDRATLTAIVPAGTLADGTHDLVLEGPYGTRGSLPGAYAAIPGDAPVLAVEPAAVPTTVLVGDPAELRVRVTNLGPGALEEVALSVKPVLAPRPDLPGAPAPQDLAEGAHLDAAFPVSTSAPGTFEFEAKASGTVAGTAVGVSSDKVRAALEVVEGFRAAAAVFPSTIHSRSDVAVTVTVVNGTLSPMSARIQQVTQVETPPGILDDEDWGRTASLPAAGGTGQVVFSCEAEDPGTVELSIAVRVWDAAGTADTLVVPVHLTILP